MDPDETLRLIQEELMSEEGPDLHCFDLYCWLERGGFEPTWYRYPSATGYYKCFAAQQKRREVKKHD